jgi:hypothetical protein
MYFHFPPQPPVPPSRWDNLPYIVAGVILVGLFAVVGYGAWMIIEAIKEVSR